MGASPSARCGIALGGRKWAGPLLPRFVFRPSANAFALFEAVERTLEELVVYGYSVIFRSYEKATELVRSDLANVFRNDDLDAGCERIHTLGGVAELPIRGALLFGQKWRGPSRLQNFGQPAELPSKPLRTSDLSLMSLRVVGIPGNAPGSADEMQALEILKPAKCYAAPPAKFLRGQLLALDGLLCSEQAIDLVKTLIYRRFFHSFLPFDHADSSRLHQAPSAIQANAMQSNHQVH